MESGIDHSPAERWLIYGHELDRELSPLSQWVTVLVILVSLLVVILVIREFDLLTRLRRRVEPEEPEIETDDDESLLAEILAELRAQGEALSQLPSIKEHLAQLRIDVDRVADELQDQSGRLAGATDAMKGIVREAARHEREMAQILREERERIQDANDSIREFVARIPPAGSG